MEIQGKVKVIGEIETFGSKGFRKASLVLDVTEKPEYPQFVNIDITQDNTDLLSKYKIGDDLKVSINIGGRSWTNPRGEVKYFNSITGWKIEKAESTQAPETSFEPVADLKAEAVDDLPF